VHTTKTLPHILYLLATEGKRIELQAFEHTHLVKKDTSMLFLGTKEEWQKILEDAAMEDRFGLSHNFKVLEMPLPDARARRELLLQSLRSPEISSLRYKYDLKGVVADAEKEGFSAAKAEEELVRAMVTRCDEEAHHAKMNGFISFMKFRNLLT